MDQESKQRRSPCCRRLHSGKGDSENEYATVQILSVGWKVIAHSAGVAGRLPF